MKSKQISPAKRAANKKNAQKSTGPRTAEGKSRSSRNALKHGLLANTIILDDADPNESPDDFADLTAALIDDFAPTTAHERILVERLAVCYWRLRRAHRFEVQSIKNLRDPKKRPTLTALRAAMGVESNPTEHVLPPTKDLDKLVRYESMIDRELNRTLTQLKQAHHRAATVRERPTPKPQAQNEPTAVPSVIPSCEPASPATAERNNPVQRMRDPRATPTVSSRAPARDLAGRPIQQDSSVGFE